MDQLVPEYYCDKQTGTTRIGNHFYTRNRYEYIKRKKEDKSYFINDETIRVLPYPETNIVRKNTFMFNKYIKVVYFDNSITKIDDYAFFNCKNLETIYLPKNLIKLGKNSFAYCVNLKNIFIYDKLLEIGDFSFEKCVKIKNLELPNSVIKIGAGAF